VVKREEVQIEKGGGALRSRELIPEKKITARSKLRVRGVRLKGKMKSLSAARIISPFNTQGFGKRRGGQRDGEMWG